MHTPKFSSNFAGSVSNLKLSAQEMLVISEEISREFAVRPPRYTPESVCVLMPVDPEHVHAYWHLDKKQLETVNNSTTDNELVLRIFSRPDKTTNVQTEQYFDVICDRSETQQTITLPQDCLGSKYSAAIGQNHQDNKFVVFASSDITFLPRLGSKPFQYQQQSAGNVVVSHFLSQNSSGKGKA